MRLSISVTCNRGSAVRSTLEIFQRCGWHNQSWTQGNPPSWTLGLAVTWWSCPRLWSGRNSPMILGILTEIPGPERIISIAFNLRGVLNQKQIICRHIMSFRKEGNNNILWSSLAFVGGSLDGRLPQLPVASSLNFWSTYVQEDKTTSDDI